MFLDMIRRRYSVVLIKRNGKMKRYRKLHEYSHLDSSGMAFLLNGLARIEIRWSNCMGPHTFSKRYIYRY